MPSNSNHNANQPAPDRSPVPEASTLAELRRRWAPLQGELNRLNMLVANAKDVKRMGKPYVSVDRPCNNPRQRLYSEAEIDAEIDRRQTTAANRRLFREFERQRIKLKDCLADWQTIFVEVAAEGGLAAFVARQNKVKRAVDRLVDEIAAAPIATIEDIASVLDIALDREIDIRADAGCDDDESMWFSRRLLRGLMALLPGFEFHSLKSTLPPEQYANLVGATPA
jgi:hypothetical protein